MLVVLVVAWFAQEFAIVLATTWRKEKKKCGWGWLLTS